MKDENQYRMDELLVKYLLKEADANEISAVEAWLQDREENRRYFEGFRTIWEESKRLAPVSVDEQAAWQKFQQRLSGKKPTVLSLPARSRRPLVSAAAIIGIIIAGAFMAYYFGNRSGTLHFESGERVLVCELPDGSVVTLNRHATLDYSKNGKDGLREARLEGEGFFEVSPDKKHPFLVRVGAVKVSVVGTSFNIRAGDEKTEVAVETGIVHVSNNNHSVLVERNERAIVLKADGRPRKFRSTDNLYNYYRSREMVCNGTPLRNVVDMLNEAYDAHIIIANPAIESLPLNTTIPAGAGLDSILEMIEATFNIQAERQGHAILLR